MVAFVFQPTLDRYASVATWNMKGHIVRKVSFWSLLCCLFDSCRAILPQTFSHSLVEVRWPSSVQANEIFTAKHNETGERTESTTIVEIVAKKMSGRRQHCGKNEAKFSHNSKKLTKSYEILFTIIFGS